MSSLDHELARDYFASHLPSLWDWQDDGEVVAWFDSSTISFRLEIGVVLSRLKPIGLPRFGAIVLLLAACRESWRDESGGRDLLLQYISFGSSTEPRPMFEDVVKGLDRLHSLRGMLPYPATKAELAALIFEAAKYRWPATPTETVVKAFHRGLPSTTFAPSPRRLSDTTSFDIGALLADMADLRPGLALLDRQSLERRLQTGIEKSIQPALVELPPGVAARQLIRELADDNELGGVARLARLLLAAVQFPRPLYDPEELPVGGVSDITNRGPLDRLMLTELAQDDLTLAVRVAMNEALYLRREPLPRNSPRQRFVLIDSGLRMWGVPRVFAAAVGLAVAAQADKNLKVCQWRACGTRLVAVDFTSARGLTAHLAELDHRVHPGESLATFAAVIEEAAVSSDAMIITTEDVLADQEFCRELQNVNLESLHIAAVQRDGSFRLVQRTGRGTKVLRSAQFSLDEVLAPSPKATPLIHPRALPNLPAIYGVQPFPLRLSVPISFSRNSWFVTPWDSLVTLTKDGRLVRWESTQFGARQIADGLPVGNIHCCSERPSDEIVTMVIGKLSQRGLYSVQLNLKTGFQNVRRLQLTQAQPRKVILHQGVILVLFAKEVNAFDPGTGALLDARENPYGSSPWGRFVPLQSGRDGSTHWSAISFDGSTIQFEVLCRTDKSVPALLAVFDTPSLPDGPVGVTADAHLVFLGSGKEVPLPVDRKSFPVVVGAVSHDGLQFVMTVLAKVPNYFLVHVVAQRVEPFVGNSIAAIEPKFPFCAEPQSVRRRFRGILVDELGRLTLVSRKGSLWPLELDAKGEAIVLPKKPASLRPNSEFLVFETIPESSTGGRELSVARWPDGSMAVLDHLGLLHLRSSNSAIPDCTIVLSEGATSGWVSGGRFWGKPYFIGTNPATPAKLIWKEVLQPFIWRLQVHYPGLNNEGATPSRSSGW